ARASSGDRDGSPVPAAPACIPSQRVHPLHMIPDLWRRSQMKIAIIGVGALGSVYAALLASGGHDVSVVDVWTEHIEAIRKNGLRLEGASGDRTVRIHATTDPADVREVDLVTTRPI